MTQESNIKTPAFKCAPDSTKVQPKNAPSSSGGSAKAAVQERAEHYGK